MSPDFPTVRSAPAFLQLSPFQPSRSLPLFCASKPWPLDPLKLLAAETSLMKTLCFAAHSGKNPHHSLDMESRAVFPLLWPSLSD